MNPGPFSVPANPANVDAANLESGEYGFEDFVNPTTAAGTPSSDSRRRRGHQRQWTARHVWAEFPSSVNAAGVATRMRSRQGGSALYDPLNLQRCDDRHQTRSRPWNTVNYAQAMVNRTYLFRRALKLVHGSLGNIVTPGLTVVTENPVYIQGDWNANQAVHPGELRESTRRDVGDRRCGDAALERVERRRVVREPVQSRQLQRRQSLAQHVLVPPRGHRGQRAWRSHGRPPAPRRTTSAPTAARTTSSGTSRAAAP